MAEEALRITITADNKDAVKKIQDTILALDGVEKAGKKSGDAMKKVGTDFTGLSRVIQDLPYGFNAISNNLTQLVPAAGAAGLAFSGIVAALSFAQTGLSNWTRGLKLASDTTNFMNKVSANYVENIAKERSALDSLYMTATNANIPMQIRNEAVAQMQKQYGSYLQNMDAEAIKAGLAADAYQRIVDALDKKAMAQAAEGIKVEKFQELIKLQQERNLLDEQYGKIPVVKNNAKGYQEITTSAKGVVEVLKDNNTLTGEAALKAKEYDNKLADLNKRTMVVWASIGMLNKTIQENQTMTFDLPAPDKENLSAWAKEQLYLENINREYAALTALQQRRKNEKLGIVTQEQLQLQKQELVNLTLSTQSNIALRNVLNNQVVVLDLIRQKNNEAFATEASEFFTSRIGELFTQMTNGVSIGDALSNMFKRLAIDIAMAAAKAAIFQAILTSLTGGGAVAVSPAGGLAGFGSRVAGSVPKQGGGFFSIFKKLLGFSEGGTVSGPKSGYPVMLHGTEHIVRPDQMRSIIASAAQMGGGNSRVIVEGRIRGNDIFLSQQRTGQFRSLTT